MGGKNSRGNAKSHPVSQIGLMVAPQKLLKNRGLSLSLFLLAHQLLLYPPLKFNFG